MCRINSEPATHEPPMVQVTSEKPANSEKPSNKTKFKKQGFIWAGIITVFVLVVATIVLIIFDVKVKKEQNKNINKTTEIIEELVALPITSIDKSKSRVRIVTKNEWEALPRNGNLPELESPIKYVILCHTAGRFCDTSEKCTTVIKWIQNNNISNQKLPDIVYNFILGGDEQIYEGRGWQKQNNLKSDSITIGVIGNYVFDTLTEEMVQNLKDFLQDGVDSGRLDKSYFVVAHNQTRNTLSPGQNIVREIKTWEHYKPGLID